MTGFIYAIESGGFIKIGWSNDPQLRLNKIRADSPHECVLLGFYAATRAEEKAIQKQLSPWRVRGEWFRNDGEVPAFIRGLIPFEKRRKFAGVPNGSPIREFRRTNRLTLTQFGALAGVEKSVASKWENFKLGVSPRKAIAIDRATSGVISKCVLRPDLWPSPQDAVTK